MDGASFDRVSRRLAGVTSRRAAIAVVLAGLAGGVAVADAGAAQTCRVFNRKCVRNTQCCSGVCETRRSVPRIRRNRCACPAPRLVCGGQCIDPKTDIAHCGACGDACDGLADTCVAGACACGDDDACDADIADACLNGACVCGAGPACTGGKTCVDGVCQPPDCTIAQGARLCVVTTERDVIQVVWDGQANGPDCTASDQCQAFRAECASTETCFCAASLRLPGNGLLAWSGCHAYPTANLQN
jgi:hypothetical protein